jgi:hypothetical protein
MAMECERKVTTKCEMLMLESEEMQTQSDRQLSRDSLHFPPRHSISSTFAFQPPFNPWISLGIPRTLDGQASSSVTGPLRRLRRLLHPNAEPHDIPVASTPYPRTHTLPSRDDSTFRRYLQVYDSFLQLVSATDL